MFLKIFTFLSMTFFTLFLIWGLGWIWFATTVALAKPEQVQTKTQAIIVLTGGNYRINEGLNLLNKKAAPQLFISGVNENVTKADILSSWDNKNSLKPCCVYLGYEAKDTIENAVEVQKWVVQNKIENFRLVTSNYHMNRAYLEISKVLPNTEIIKHAVISTKDFENWKGRFWSLTFSEYNKSLIRWFGLYNKNNN